MTRAKLAVVVAGAALAVLLWNAAPVTGAAAGRPPAPAAFAIRDVRVFDGEVFRAGQTVRVQDGLIAAVGADVVLPAGIEVVDGRGRTLLPGLVDAHVHTWAEARRDALRFGVTTVIDMFSDHRQLAAARRERADTTQAATADMWSAGTLATTAGGHGTQYGLDVPVLAGPADAPAWVAARQAEGSDFIKIVREDLHVYSDVQTLPSLGAATAAALVAAAHERGLRAVVHASAQASARESLRAGADGLVHVFQDAPADADFVSLAKERGAFVVPTLSVIASFAGREMRLADGPDVAPWLSSDQQQSLAAKMHFGAPAPELLANAVESVRRLHAAGVPILAGTDAPNPGTAHGASLHGELRLLHEAGLSNAQALAAATSVPARAFGLDDRGRIAVGLRADLVLVEGDPGADLAATQAIVAIWKNGRPVDRRVVATDAPPLAAGTISHFDEGRLDSRVGSGWVATSDRMAGGGSDARIDPQAGGAAGTAGAMAVSGVVVAGSAQVWAGAFLNPGDRMMQAMDASGLTEIVLQVRGDGRPLSVLVFSGAEGAAPSVQQIEIRTDWREVRLPLASFAGADPARVRAIAVTTATPGPFSFALDEFEIR